jgi:hypothetical protein
MNASEKKRRYRERLRSTPEGREILRAWERARYERIKSTPEGRARLQEKSRRSQIKKMSTPEGLAKHAERQRRWRAKNKAAYDAICRRYAMKQCVSHSEDLYMTIARLVPNTYGQLRNDIISEVYLGVLEGKYPKKVTSTHVKDAARILNRDSYKLVSLEAPRGDATLMGVY